MMLNFIIPLLLLTGSSNSAQTNRIIYLIDSTVENCKEQPCNHLVVYQIENRYFELLKVNAYADDFVYKGNLILEDNIQYFLFSSYGSAAGVTKLFYIDKLTHNVFETDYFLEYEIPMYYSMNTNTLTISCISFSSDDCGIVKDRKVLNKSIAVNTKDSLPGNHTIVFTIFID
jgi:hypothetical protein